jgi:Terminase RNaseH-like domain
MGALMGVDIGQKRDPTAICVAESEDRQDGFVAEEHFVVRHLERLPLGTPYPEVARRVGAIAAGVWRRTGETPELYVDATGVGTPIVDLLREKAPSRQSIVAVYLTHGDRRTEDRAEGYRQVKLGKAFLVSRLQALLKCKRVHLPNTSEASALAQELLDYEIRVDENATDRYGAFRVGTHDDLVTALGLAVQIGERIFPAVRRE